MLRLRALWLSAVSAAVAFTAIAQDGTVPIGRYRAHPTRMLARYQQPAQAVSQSTLSTLRSLGIHVKRHYPGLAGVVLLDAQPRIARLGQLTPQQQADQLVNQIALLRDSGLFAYVEPDFYVTNLVTPSDAAFVDGRLWGLRNTGQDGGKAGADIAAVEAWDITTGSTNVVVGVIDTGIRYTHKDLELNMWRNPGETPGNGVDDDNDGYVDNVFGINALAGSGDPMDDHAHGSHVAGTIAASANDNHPHVGVSWRASLVGLKFLSAGGGGFTGDAIECIRWATLKNIKILNNSWGGGPFEQALEDAIRFAYTNGVLFVAAAGNSAEDNDLTPHYPSSYDVPNVLAVAALDRKDKLAYFSNWGKTSVHVGAPGVEIFSCTADSDTSYGTFDGTSMASPHVAGVAALILAKFPQAPALEIKERIVRSVVPVDDLKDTTITGGRANAYNALLATPDGQLEVYLTPPDKSYVLLSTNLGVFVRINDLFDVTNATVVATLVDTNLAGTNLAIVSPLAFTNNGVPPDIRSNDAVYSAKLDLTAFVTNVIEYKLDIQASGKTNFTTNFVYYIVPRPTNDAFAAALKIPSAGAFDAGLILATNTFASFEAREPLHGRVPTVANSLWWKYSPLGAANILVDTAGSSFDTVVAVYTGTQLSALTEVASANDVGNRKQANLTFSATAGATYYIAVAGATTNETGVIRLRVEPNGQPDTVAPFLRIVNPPSGKYVTINKIDVTGTASDPTPNGSGVKEVVVRVNAGLGRPASGTTNWVASANLQTGLNTISVSAVDFSDNISTPLNIVVHYLPVESPNDVFAQAILLARTNGTSTVTNRAATKETGEPLHAGNEGGKSVWWRWTAPENGLLYLDTDGSAYDTLLGLYTGETVATLTTVASNDDALPTVTYSKLRQAVHAQQTYAIAVDGFGGASGKTVLNYSFVPTNILTVTITSDAGGTTTPPPGRYDVEAGSTVTVTARANDYYVFGGWTGGVLSSDNPVAVPVKSSMALHAVFRPVLYADDFESGALKQLGWTTTGDAAWTVQTNVVARGTFAAQSGKISHSQRSSLALTAMFRAGNVRFDYKVSSEAGWDFLEFYVDGVRQDRWSGEVGWLGYQRAIAAGQHTLEWRYVKDTANSAGADAAYLDNLDLPLEVPVSPASAATLAMQRVQTGALQVRVQGQTNQIYVIQGSGDLLKWRPLTTNQAFYGVIQFYDADALNQPQRFYRAVAQ